jgi:predicted  nucleic acid-binding Zn-ribbon protein
MPKLTNGQKLFRKYKKQVQKAKARARFHKSQIDLANSRIKKINRKIKRLEECIRFIEKQRKLDEYKVQCAHHHQQINFYANWIQVFKDQVEEIDTKVKPHRILYHTIVDKYYTIKL